MGSCPHVTTVCLKAAATGHHCSALTLVSMYIEFIGCPTAKMDLLEQPDIMDLLSALLRGPHSGAAHTHVPESTLMRWTI